MAKPYDLLGNAQEFEALYEEFLAKARPLLNDSARSDRFNSDEAHGCLDEIEGFALTIRDHLMAAARDDAEAWVSTGHPNDPSSRVYRVPAAAE